MVLVVGSGGREHAIVKALRASPKVEKVFVWPGNAGIARDADVVPIEKGLYNEIVEWAVANKIELVVIGPEVELVAGLADQFRAKNILVFGPSQKAAKLEASKIFAKEFMQEFGVPTARADVVKSVKDVLACAPKYSTPYVLKADGLAGGKGVTLSQNSEELRVAAVDLFDDKKLGEAGERALLEEFLPGKEISVLVLTNGKQYEMLPFCRDHKRQLDGDKGPNTGGMGVVGPIQIEESTLLIIKEKIVEPTVRGLQKRDFDYRGVIFIGVMLTSEGPSVLEYNVRFGDPETQALLPLLDGDWYEVFYKLSQGEILPLKWKKESVACVVLAADGYPESPRKGAIIEGSLNDEKNIQVLHAGTTFKDDKFAVNGGRVLNVVATAAQLETALTAAYSKIAKINWPGMQYRRDIGKT